MGGVDLSPFGSLRSVTGSGSSLFKGRGSVEGTRGVRRRGRDFARGDGARCSEPVMFG